MSYKEEGMSLIVKVITRITVGLILLYGVYITTHGHLSPGGGFAGGVIIALSFIHIVLAFGKKNALKNLSNRVISFFESLGAILFLIIAVLGYFGGYFFSDWFKYKGKVFSLFSGGYIPLSNLAIGIKVSFGLFAIFLGLVMFKFIIQRK